jgi:hypothetical protein
MRDFEGELVALRAGSITFSQVARALTPMLTARAAWFLRRWRQTLLVESDLVQEMLIAVWRAVDTFDPMRSADLPRWVDTQIGRAAEVELARAAGWPDKRRKPVARQAHVEDVAVLVGGYEPSVETELDRGRLVTRLAERLTPADQSVLAALVQTGGGKIAETMYADRSVRLERCWDSGRHAHADVRETMKRIETVLDTTTTKEGAV